MTTDYEAQYLALCGKHEGLRRWQSHGHNYKGPCRIAGKHFCGPLPEAERLGALVEVAHSLSITIELSLGKLDIAHGRFAILSNPEGDILGDGFAECDTAALTAALTVAVEREQQP